MHKLFFISINMFFCFLDLFLYFIDTVETHRKVFDMEYHNLRNSIQQCISMSWNSGPRVNEWTCGTDPYGWYFLRSSNINVHNFAPWFLGPLLATSVIFTVHYLKEHKLVTFQCHFEFSFSLSVSLSFRMDIVYSFFYINNLTTTTATITQ